MTPTTEYKISFEYHVDGQAQAELTDQKFAKMINEATQNGLKVEFSSGTEPVAEGLKLIKLIIDEEDEYITQDSSITVKQTLKDYFASNGLPDTADGITDPTIKFISKTFQDEFGEACEEFEHEAAPKL